MHACLTHLDRGWRTMGIAAIAIVLAATSSLAVELQGHRGARGLLPENTMPAFEAALANGVDVLELDTGVTKDGHVVVHHDIRLSPDIARATNGKWIAEPGPLLTSLTLAELRQFDVGRARPDGRVARRFKQQRPVDGTQVPTLSEVLALGQRQGNETLGFNVETKLNPHKPGDTMEPDVFARAVLSAVSEAGLQDRVTIQSFDWRTLRAAKEMAPEVTTACLTAEQNWLNNLEIGQPGTSPWTAGIDVDDHDGSPARSVQAAGCDIWSPFHRDVSQARLAEAHALGLKVIVWTVNKASDMKRLAEMGVDGIITDYPDRGADALKSFR